MDNLLQKDTGNPSDVETETEAEIGEMDRISQLPEFIIHRILSFLIPWDNPPSELVRMSVLSKNWFHLTASFPVLRFRHNGFGSRESFFKYMEYTTTRFCHQNIIAHKFDLVTTLVEPVEVDIVNRCLELVLKNGVMELDISITNSSENSPSASANPLPRYRLPDTLLSVSVLKSLTIRGCKLPSSLMVDDVTFKSLIELTLDNVQIDDEVIKYLTASCPLLHVFHIKNCHGLKRFGVYGHQNLQTVWIDCNKQVERIDIEAPNLSSLWVVDMYVRGAPPMNMASCKKLTTVSYFGHSLPNDFLSCFPFVEHLIFATLYKCNNLKWSTHSLRTLVLESDCDLEDIEFSTPNLVLFIYACSSALHWPMIMDKHWPLLRDSTHLKACMQCFPGSSISTLWFQKLRRFLDKKNPFKVLNLYIYAIYDQKFTELESLKAIELPPYELEHVELELDTNEESLPHIAFVDAVLWCCRPRSLTLRLLGYIPDFEEQVKVGKFTYEKLLEQEDNGHTTIQFVGSSSSETQKHLMDYKSLSTALPRDRSAVCFIKEKVAQEKAG